MGFEEMDPTTYSAAAADPATRCGKGRGLAEVQEGGQISCPESTKSY